MAAYRLTMPPERRQWLAAAEKLLALAHQISRDYGYEGDRPAGRLMRVWTQQVRGVSYTCTLDYTDYNDLQLHLNDTGTMEEGTTGIVFQAGEAGLEITLKIGNEGHLTADQKCTQRLSYVDGIVEKCRNLGILK